MIELDTIYNEDCLIGMQRIPDKSVDAVICDLYDKGYTLRHIGEIVGKDHHYIKRRLLANSKIIERHKTKKPYTDEHRKKISLSCKGRKTWSEGKKMTREHNIKNMLAHLKYRVDFDWLNSFEDIEKLKFLNRSISRKRDCCGFTTEIYKCFIEKFYYDKKFNDLYNKWVKTKDKWIKPSLDHVKPKSEGGSLLLDNLRFISWFENRAKESIDYEQWEKMKQNIKYYL